MRVTKMGRSGIAMAVAGAISLLGLSNSTVHAQTVNLAASDGLGNFGVNTYLNGNNWAASSDALLTAGTPTTAGYNYVVSGPNTTSTWTLNTPYNGGTTGGTYNFPGNSLTINPTIAPNFNSSSTGSDGSAFLALSSPGNSTLGISNLILSNGGAIENITGAFQSIGRFYIPFPDNPAVPDLITLGTPAAATTVTTAAGITPTSGIIDVRGGALNGLRINSNIVGTGSLSINQTNSTSYSTSIGVGVQLQGSNTFSGGLSLQNLATAASQGQHYPVVIINSPTALGTGPLTIHGGTIDQDWKNLAPLETLTTNNAQTWANNFYYGGTGSLDMGNGPVSMTADIILTAQAPIATAPGTLFEDGVISGNYSLRFNSISGVNSFAQLCLTGANTYTGGTIIGSGAALELTNNQSTNFATATNPAPFSAFTLTSTTATLVLAVGSANPFAVQDITNAYTNSNGSSGGIIGVDTTSVSGPFVYGASLSGTRGLAAFGTGLLQLTGTNTYTGTTGAFGGTLQAGGTNVFSPKSTLSVTNNARVDLNGYNQSVGQLSGANAFALSNVTNNGSTPATLIVNTISSSGGLFPGMLTDGNSQLGLTFNGTNGTTGTPNSVFTLQGTNTYSGLTTLNGGGLLFNSAAALSPNTTVLFNGGWLEFGIGFNVSNVQFSTQASQTFNIYTNANSGTINGSGTNAINSLGGSLVKYTSGTLSLSGTNTYTGATTLLSNSGTLQINTPSAILNTSSITVNAGSSFVINDTSGLAGLSGAAIGGTPIPTALNGSTGNPAVLAGAPNIIATWNGSIVVAGSPATITGGQGSSAASPGVLNVNGAISGAGPVQFSSNAFSTTILNGANTYTGETQIATPAGSLSTLKLGVDNSIPASSGVNLSSAGGNGVLDLNGHVNTVAYLSDAGGTGSIINSASSPAQLTISTTAANNTYYAGAIKDNTSSVGITVSGSGRQTLGGAGNYSGGTTVAGGTLVVSSNAALGTGPVTLSGGTLALAVPVATLPGAGGAGAINGLSASTFTANKASAYTTGAGNFSGGTYAVTDGITNSETTSVFTNTAKPISTNAGFVAKYSYQTSGGTTSASAYGAAFVLQNGKGATALGGGTASIGYSGTTNFNNSIAIPLSILNISGSYSPGVLKAPLYNNSSTSFFNSQVNATAAAGVVLNSGHPINVTLTYNANAQSLIETLVDSLTSASYTQTYSNVNLAALFPAGQAFVGFTGSSGPSTSFTGQLISNFTFANNALGPATLANNFASAPGTSSALQLSVSSGNNVASIGLLNLGSGSTVNLSSVVTDTTATRGVLTTTGISGTGRLNLASNDLIVKNGGAAGLAQITSLVQSGYDSGTWNGTTGILSSSAAASPLLTLGTLLNDNGAGAPYYGAGGTIAATLDGSTPALGDVLVKFTYYGDTNLDGKVDGSDYSRIDAGFIAQTSGWANGDFNYDGLVNGSDYTLIDNAYNTQGAVLAASIASPNAQVTAQLVGTSAVPEPATLGLLSVAALGMLGRRRQAFTCARSMPK